MSATTEAYDLFSYELSKVKEKLRTASITEKATPEADILFLHTTRRRETVSQVIEDTRFHGRFYLFHHWTCLMETAWTRKRSLALVFIIAFFTWYTGEELCLADIIATL